MNNYNNVQWFFIELVLWMVSWNSKCSRLYGSNRILLRAHITYIHLICICSSAIVDLESLYRQGNLFIFYLQFSFFIFFFSVQLCMYAETLKCKRATVIRLKIHSQWKLKCIRLKPYFLLFFLSCIIFKINVKSCLKLPYIV